MEPWDWKRKSVDRLSSLPDDILIHILAFLPTKIYVKTSILGRRWRFLWARVPNLDFDDEDEEASRFPSIVNRVMLLHKRQNINSFRFHCYQSPVECSAYEFEKWITTAVDCNVQEVDLSLAYELCERLPKCIFTCKTLVSLSLSCFEMPIIGTVYLLALKKLRLEEVDFKSVECFGNLLSGCPVLNELFMHNSLILKSTKKDSERENNKICISSSTINRLELGMHYNRLFSYFKRKDFGLKLDTPALKYLKFNNYIHDDYSVVHRFASFASAKTFHNLTDIDLEADWQFIKILLQKTDNLEVLAIRCRSGDKNPTHWVDPEQVPACLVSHLGTVRIHDFWCSEQDFKAVGYILRNAKFLKRMEIYPSGFGIYKMGSEKQLEALKRISLFERGSDACQLAFD